MRKYGVITDIKKEYVGHWMMNPLYNWVAYCYNEQIAQARTKKDCIQMARKRKYVVPRNM